jgi:hypothetical protein
MASVLPFDNVVVNSTAIGTDEFVAGSGSYTEMGSDKAVTTADGRIHNIREAINYSANFEVYGDKTTLQGAVGLGKTVVLKKTAATIATLTALVTAVYSHSSRTTKFTITGDPS